jgi:hypothetical protein
MYGRIREISYSRYGKVVSVKMLLYKRCSEEDLNRMKKLLSASLSALLSLCCLYECVFACVSSSICLCVSICVLVSLSVSLSVCLSLYLSVCPSVHVCVRQSYVVPRHRYEDWSAVDTLKNGEREEKRVKGRKSKGGKR